VLRGSVLMQNAVSVLVVTMSYVVTSSVLVVYNDVVRRVSAGRDVVVRRVGAGRNDVVRRDVVGAGRDDVVRRVGSGRNDVVRRVGAGRNDLVSDEPRQRVDGAHEPRDADQRAVHRAHPTEATHQHRVLDGDVSLERDERQDEH